MFKEVIISAAVILGFLLNLAFVDQPNITTYTIAFAMSLAGLSPFVLWWIYRTTKKESKKAVAVEDGNIDGTPLTSLSFWQRWRLNTAPIPEIDLEKGTIKPKDEASRSNSAEGS